MSQMLFLMVGYPGAGKTTTSLQLHDITGAEHIWADHERRQAHPEPTYSRDETHRLYERLNRRTDELLSQGKSVIFDTNFNFYKDRRRLREVAAKHGAQTVVVWVVADKELAKSRATASPKRQHTRVLGNELGNMPVDRFEKMAGNLQAPKPDERVIQVDGTKVTRDYISSLLRQAKISF